MPSYRGEVLGADIYPSFSSASTLVARTWNDFVPVDKLVYGEEDERTLGGLDSGKCVDCVEFARGRVR
ncbi:hypothetical protein L226DRAFT_537143 [Lentinus tigrinus ALCF2SS1-7]|uniref:uncharacterized protein n=1 Tax=Lentinus tigrinus ALCF2SS1-7 TaxID=1328758 RepID=UPI001165CA90|nr:hypothetical protein L226DRAFT_537143 [Lentinus tigrinus ALCF2SS1-7]